MFKIIFLLIAYLATNCSGRSYPICDERVYSNDMINSWIDYKDQKQLEPLSFYWREDKPIDKELEKLLRSIYTEPFDRFSLCKNSILNSNERCGRFENDEEDDLFINVDLRQIRNGKIPLEPHQCGLVAVFKSLCNQTLTPDFVSVEELKKKLNDLNEELDKKIVLNENLTSAFQYRPISVFYDNPIISFDNIRLERRQRLYFDHSNTVATIEYSIKIPVYNRTVSSLSNRQSNDCTPVDRLPRFFIDQTRARISTPQPDPNKLKIVDRLQPNSDIGSQGQVRKPALINAFHLKPFKDTV